MSWWFLYRVSRQPQASLKNEAESGRRLPLLHMSMFNYHVCLSRLEAIFSSADIPPHRKRVFGGFVENDPRNALIMGTQLLESDYISI